MTSDSQQSSAFLAMHSEANSVSIIGGGAIGLSLAVVLARAGRRVMVLRSASDEVAAGCASVAVTLGNGQSIEAELPILPLSQAPCLEGIVVVASKSHANESIAERLASRLPAGVPLVVLQNGLGIERPFLRLGHRTLYRGVIYASARKLGATEIAYRGIDASPIGAVVPEADQLAAVVRALDTSQFRFRATGELTREVWQKTAINAVFNSICPLLDADNGLLKRDAQVARIARAMLDECAAVARRAGVALDPERLLTQALAISERSDGQPISTLQDLRSGRPTEIRSLNLEISRMAGSLQPPLKVPLTAALGELVLARERMARERLAQV